MNKKIKSLFLAALMLTGFAGMTVSCNKDEINSLNDRVTKVENALADLQTQISNGAVITNVESTADGVKVTLSDGSSFTLTNGKDGADGQDGANGQDGAPGSVVTIGGNGNWFIDGVDTGFPSRGEKGDQGEPGEPGEPGQPGEDGEDGEDAPVVYYYPGEDGFFVKVTIAPDGTKSEEPTTVSYLVPGVVTAVWDTEKGELVLYGVEGAEEGLVISLNSTLKSLAFVPETMTQGLGLIQFYTLYDAKGNFIAANTPQVTYRVNPQNADLSNIAWSFINRGVTTKVAGDAADLISIVGEPVSGEEGGLIFTISANEDGDIPEDASQKGDNVLVALQATASDSQEQIVSDYSLVEQTKIDEYEIIKYAPYYAKTKEVIAYKPASSLQNPPALDAETNIILGYNETINVLDSLETYVPAEGKSLPEMYVSPTYKLTFPEKYLGEDGKTNQQQFVSLDTATGELSVDDAWLSQSSRPAIGRTPVIYVEAFVKNTKGVDVKIAECWLKVKIVGEKEEISDLHVSVAPATVEYSEIPDAGEQIVLGWEQVNTDILSELGLTYTEFTSLYNVNATDLKLTFYDENGKELAEAPDGVSANLEGLIDETSTNAAIVTITDAVEENLKGSVEVVIPSVEPRSRGNVVVTFSYTVQHEHVWPEFSKNYLKPGTDNTVQVKGKLDAGSGKWVMQSTIAEHFEGYLKDYAAEYAKDAQNHGPIQFALLPLVNGVPVSVAMPEDKYPSNAKYQEGAEVSGTDYTDQEIALTEPLVNSKTYVLTAYTKLDNGNYCEMYYNVEFVSPFVVVGKDIELATLIAEPSTENVQDLLVVNDLDGKAVYKEGEVTKYGADTYKLSDADFTFEYALLFSDDNAAYNPETDFNNYLTVDNGTDEISWYNGGTTLQQDMHAGYGIELTVSNICVIEGSADITVLSSANSR